MIELPITDPILQFTVLVTAALVVQLTVEKIHLPGIIGLLVIGMLIGPGGLAILPHGPVLELVGSLGLVYIMFLAGMEINLDVVREHRTETAAFGVLAFAFSLVPAVVAGLLLSFGWEAAVLLGALLSSHTLLAYPMVQRLNLVHRQSVITAVGGTLLTDTLALVVLSVVIQTQRGVEEEGLGGVTSLLLLVGLAAVSLVVLPRVSRPFFAKTEIRRSEKALFILVVLLLLSSTAELIGTEDILGAFLAGICLNAALKQREDLLEHVQFVGRMLFIPFFFVETGMHLEFAVFWGELHVWGLAALMLAIVLVGKSTAAWLMGWVYGYSRLDCTLMAGLTIPQAAATLAITMTAAEAGAFDEDFVDSVILLIFVTCLIGPLLTRFAGRRLVRT